MKHRCESSHGDLGSGSVFAIYGLSPHYESFKGRGWVPSDYHSACRGRAALNKYSLIKLLLFSSRLFRSSQVEVLGLAGKSRLGKEVDFNAR